MIGTWADVLRRCFGSGTTDRTLRTPEGAQMALQVKVDALSLLILLD